MQKQKYQRSGNDGISAFHVLGITSAGPGSVLRALGSSGLQVLLSRLEGASVLPLKPLDHETKAILGEGRKRFALPPCSVSKPLKEVIRNEHSHFALLLTWRRRAFLGLDVGLLSSLRCGLGLGLLRGVTDETIDRRLRLGLRIVEARKRVLVLRDGAFLTSRCGHSSAHA